MDITVFDAADVAVEVDTERYEREADYRRHIHQDLDIAEGQEALDWDYICATEEELAARGERPIFTTADYPTEEAASEALRHFIHALFERIRRESAASA